ncbi:MAG: hypothetical protein ACOYN0_08525 [Phycisphaerales bacterium]
MLRTDQVVVSLSPSCIRMATMRGKVVDQFERVVIDPSEWEENWSGALRQCDEHLIAMMRALKVAPGCPTTVVYHSPTVVADVFGVQAAAGSAKQAALLATRESLLGDPTSWRTAQELLSQNATPMGAGPSQAQVLTVAEQTTSLEKLAALVTRCGLRFRKAVPAKSSLLVDTSALARTLPAEPRSALVYLGDYCTALASGDNKRLSFARAVDFGYGQLAEGMMRALRKDAGATDRASAYAALFRFGIPQRTGHNDAAGGIASAIVLPSLQSVLQKYVVEIRQSLRFAFKESELARANILLTGPGASIPGLAASLSAQLDLAVERIESTKPDSRAIGAEESLGDLPACLHAMAASPWMRPPSLETDRRHTVVMGCLRAGVAAAVALLAAETFKLQNEHFGIQKGLDELRPRVDEALQRQAKTKNATLAAYTVNAAATMIAAHIGEHPDWSALLGELSRITGSDIELTEIQAAYPVESKRIAVVNLRGSARQDEQNDHLAKFIEALAASPLVASAKLVSTRTDERDAKLFQIAISPRTLPILLPWESAAAQGDTP